MALVASGYELTVDLRDTSNSSSVMRYDLEAATFAEANTDALAIIAALDPLTNARIYSYRVVQVFREDAFTLPANAENAIKAEVSGLLVGGGTGRFQIPAPVGLMFTDPSGAGYNIVKLSQQEVLDYAALFEPNSEAYIANGQNFAPPVSATLTGGRRISRGSRNP